MIVSMIDGRFFDKLEQLARRIRESIKPFGGIQLILCGDFFQLPPVPDSLSSGQKIPIKFAFEAESWSKCIQRIVALKKVFRQKEGGTLGHEGSAFWSRTLIHWNRSYHSIKYDPYRRDWSTRNGYISVGWQRSSVPWSNTANWTVSSYIILWSIFWWPIRFPLRKQVEWSNKTRLEALIGEELTYYAEDKAGWDMFGRKLTSEEARRLLDYTLAPPELRLRPGAQVMLTVVWKRLIYPSYGYYDSDLIRLEYPRYWPREWIYWDCGWIWCNESSFWTCTAIRRSSSLDQSQDDKTRYSTPRNEISRQWWPIWQKASQHNAVAGCTIPQWDANTGYSCSLWSSKCDWWRRGNSNTSRCY